MSRETVHAKDSRYTERRRQGGMYVFLLPLSLFSSTLQERAAVSLLVSSCSSLSLALSFTLPLTLSLNASVSHTIYLLFVRSVVRRHVAPTCASASSSRKAGEHPFPILSYFSLFIYFFFSHFLTNETRGFLRKFLSLTTRTTSRVHGRRCAGWTSGIVDDERRKHVARRRVSLATRSGDLVLAAFVRSCLSLSLSLPRSLLSALRDSFVLRVFFLSPRIFIYSSLGTPSGESRGKAAYTTRDMLRNVTGGAIGVCYLTVSPGTIWT